MALRALLSIGLSTMLALAGCGARRPSSTPADATSGDAAQGAVGRGAAADVSGRERVVVDQQTRELRYRGNSEAGSATPNAAELGAAPQYGKLFPIEFERGSDTLKQGEMVSDALGALRAFLISHPRVHVRIEGHTDAKGANPRNRELANRRAVSVMVWLADHGVDSDRLEAIGHGDDRPRLIRDEDDGVGVDPVLQEACSQKVVPDRQVCEDQAWSRNRRIEFYVTKGSDALLAELKKESTEELEPDVEPKRSDERTSSCNLALGPRLGILGPNTFANVGLLVQPRVCWLEVAASGGVMFNTIDDAFNNVAIPLMARGRFFLGERHALVPELGAGATLFRQSGGGGSSYERAGTVFATHVGLGYGYRASTATGLRFGVSAGLLAVIGTLPSGNAPELDAQTDSLLPEPAVRFSNGTEIAPYGELSLGWALDADQP